MVYFSIGEIAGGTHATGVRAGFTTSFAVVGVFLRSIAIVLR